jgi:hypothetical protein
MLESPILSHRRAFSQAELSPVLHTWLLVYDYKTILKAGPAPGDPVKAGRISKRIRDFGMLRFLLVNRCSFYLDGTRLALSVVAGGESAGRSPVRDSRKATNVRDLREALPKQGQYIERVSYG